MGYSVGFNSINSIDSPANVENMMNERDGEAIQQARMKALEEIALECFVELCSPLSEEICKARLEHAIEARASGCGQIQR